MKPGVAHVMVNSAHRVSGDQSHYTYVLSPEQWTRKVVNVQLIEAVFPKTQQVVNEWTNILEFRERGRDYLTQVDLTVEDIQTTRTVALPHGNYAAGDLIHIMNGGMLPQEDGSHGSFRLRYNFEVNHVTGKMTISTTPPAPYETHEEAVAALGFTNTVEFLFDSGDQRDRSLHHILGFDHQDTGPGYSHTSQRHINLSSSPFVDVALEQIPSNATKISQRRDPFTGEMKAIRVLARVPLEVPNYQIKYFKPEAFDLLTKDTFYPMAMPTVTVKLYDNRGNPYEAAGFDHYITLAFTYLGPDFSGKDQGPRRRPDVILLDEDIPDKDPPDAPKEKEDGGIDPKIVALVGAGGIVAAYVVYRQFKPAGPPPF